MPAVTIAHFAGEILGNAVRRGLADSTAAAKGSGPARALAASTTTRVRHCVRKTSDLTEKTIGAWIEAFPARSVGTVKSHLRALRDDAASLQEGLAPRRPVRGRRRRPVDQARRPACVPTPPVVEIARGYPSTARSGRRSGEERILACRARPGLCIHPVFNRARGRARSTALMSRISTRDFRRSRSGPSGSPAGEAGGPGGSPRRPAPRGTIPIGEKLVRVLQEWLVRRPRHPRRRDDCTVLFPGERWMGPWTGGGKGVRPLDRVKALAGAAGIGPTWRKSARKGIGAHGKLIGLESLERTGIFRHADAATSEAYNDEQVDSLRPAVAKIERFYLHGT